MDSPVRGNELVGIDIDNASAKAIIHHLVLNRLPATVETIAG